MNSKTIPATGTKIEEKKDYAPTNMKKKVVRKKKLKKIYDSSSESSSEDSNERSLECQEFSALGNNINEEFKISPSYSTQKIEPHSILDVEHEMLLSNTKVAHK